jgi:hypothetical protein
MSTTSEVSFEPLTIGGSNFDSWSAHVLNKIRTFGPHAEQVVVASILPPCTRVDNFDLSNLSREELECWKLNTQVTDYIRSTLSCDVQELIYDDIVDAHDIWEIIQEDNNKNVQELNHYIISLLHSDIRLEGLYNDQMITMKT